MKVARRTLVKIAGLLPMIASQANGANAGKPSSVRPRHVLCFLGGEQQLQHLADAASFGIGKFATGFSVDKTYSQDRPDPGMVPSFGLCWDRAAPNGWTKDDEEAVANHKCVHYVLGPPMMPDTADRISAAALLLLERLIKAGTTAIKGESAGVAHGLARWRQLAYQGGDALKSDDDLALSRACRLAFAKRPLESAKYFESVGFHLVGLPEVYVAKTLGTDLEKAAMMDTIADEMKQRGVQAVVRDRKATLSFESRYREDDFKFDPYGIVYIDRR
jgi:hypothetical protein